MLESIFQRIYGLIDPLMKNTEYRENVVKPQIQKMITRGVYKESALVTKERKEEKRKISTPPGLVRNEK